jgi:hypothetical protein
MGGVGGAFADPAFEEGGSVLRELELGGRGRHDFVGVCGMEAAEQFAGLRFAGDDGGFPGLSGGECAGACVQAQIALAPLVVHAVALETVAGEERPDLAVEVEGLLPECGVGGDRAAKEGKQESGNEEDTHRSEWVSVAQGGERRGAVGGVGITCAEAFPSVKNGKLQIV